MLEKERFLAIKKLARDIRRENDDFFDELENEPVEIAIKKKNEFLENTINNMASAFSSGEQGREEKQIFRANILMPDDEEFYESYSKDKNIRNLMNKYSVNIEDIMSKITELNIYGKFIEENDDNDFVDEMVKISPKEAEDLLDEIDSLSNTLTDLDLNIKEYQASLDSNFENDELEDNHDSDFEETNHIKINSSNKSLKDDKKSLERDTVFESEDVVDDVLGDSFDNINTAISGFVVDYNNVKNELKQKTKYISSLETNVKNLTNENEKLKVSSEKQVKEYKELSSENTNLKTELTDLKNENSKLNKRMKVLEDKLYKSATLLKKVYTGIKN